VLCLSDMLDVTSLRFCSAALPLFFQVMVKDCRDLVMFMASGAEID
jgi:hypothetical protein